MTPKPEWIDGVPWCNTLGCPINRECRDCHDGYTCHPAIRQLVAAAAKVLEVHDERGYLMPHDDTLTDLRAAIGKEKK